MVLPASMRLRGSRCFERLQKGGYRFYGTSMVLRVIEADPQLLKAPHRHHNSTACRCAVVISSKVSKRAVIRNRLRRLLHEHLRSRLEVAPEHANHWVLISLKPVASATESSPLLEECDRLLHQAGLLS
ncbi:MAG: ribonuclease P protein component [Cyanobacteriota bacterium]|nr:ribonuclease P protein component [Cyanobacteriota bacterium]